MEWTKTHKFWFLMTYILSIDDKDMIVRLGYSQRIVPGPFSLRSIVTKQWWPNDLRNFRDREDVLLVVDLMTILGDNSRQQRCDFDSAYEGTTVRDAKNTIHCLWLCKASGSG